MFRDKPLFAVALLISANLTFAAAPIVDAQDIRSQNFTQQDENSRQQNQLIAELVMQLNQLQTEIRQLRGQVEEQDYKIKQLTQQQRDMYVDIDQRINGAPAGVVSDPTGATTDSISGGASGDSSSASVASNASEQAVTSNQAQVDYNEAIQQLEAKKFAFAKSSFRNFTANYPAEPLASNAHYWLGQLLYRDKEFAKAEEEFKKVFEQFPNAQKKDVAMMKLGQIHEKRNEKAQAVAMYERLAQEFPSTTAGKFARAKLDTLR